VKRPTSLAHQWGSMRAASANMPIATTTNPAIHSAFTMPVKHRRRRHLAGVAVLAILVLGACGGGTDRAAPPGPSATLPAPVTTRSAQAPAKPARPSGTLPQSTMPAQTTTTASPTTSAAPTPSAAPGGNDGPVPETLAPPPPGQGSVFPVGDASEGYGRFGPFEVQPLGRAEAAVRQAVDAYVEAAVFLPLRSGARANLQGVLSAVALSHLGAAQRAVLTDEGLPLVLDAAPERFDVAVDGMIGPDGAGVATASITLVVTGKATGGGPVVVRRSGVLALIPEGTAWRIDSFDLTVERDV
jgi:hypothetical protein